MHLKNSLLPSRSQREGSNKVSQTGPDEPHSETGPAELQGRGSLWPTEGVEVALSLSPKHGNPHLVRGGGRLAAHGPPPSGQPRAAEMDRGALGPVTKTPEVGDDLPNLSSASWGLGS